jgi:hypothetical protein
MDVSDLRKRILRALDEARKDASARRAVVDEASREYEKFLSDIAVPVMRQAASVLTATGHPFAVHTPAGSVRLAADASSQTFIELELDVRSPDPLVLGRVSVQRGRQGMIVEERPVAAGKKVVDLNEDDMSAFLVAEVPKLVLRP